MTNRLSPRTTAAAPRTPTLSGVDAGNPYEVKFCKDHSQYVRIIGKDFDPKATIWLHSRKCKWDKSKHKNLEPLPGELFGLPGLQVILLQDTPRERSAADQATLAEPIDPERDADSGDLIVTVSNDGSPNQFKQYNVDYV